MTSCLKQCWFWMGVPVPLNLPPISLSFSLSPLFFFPLFVSQSGRARRPHVLHILMCALARIKRPTLTFSVPSLTDRCPHARGSWMACLKWAMIVLKDGYLTGHICLLFSMLLFTRVRLRSRPGCTMKGSISDKLVNIGASYIDYLEYRFLYRHLSEFPPSCFSKDRLHAAGCAGNN